MGYHIQTLYGGFQIRASNNRAFPVRAGARISLGPTTLRDIRTDLSKDLELPEAMQEWIRKKVGSGKMTRDQARQAAQKHFLPILKREERERKEKEKLRRKEEREREKLQARLEKRRAKRRAWSIQKQEKRKRILEWAQDKTFLLVSPEGHLYQIAFSGLQKFASKHAVSLNHLLESAYGEATQNLGWGMKVVA